MDDDEYIIDISSLSTDTISIDPSVGDFCIDRNNINVYTYSPYTVGTDTFTITDSSITNVDDLIINRPGKSPVKVAQTLESIMERLAILEPDFDKMDRYPALREAYDNYKTIEALLVGDDAEQ